MVNATAENSEQFQLVMHIHITSLYSLMLSFSCITYSIVLMS